MEFREWLRQQMGARKWGTLGEAEVHLGVSKSMLSRYLRGLERPDLRTVRKIGLALDADTEEIERMLALPEPANFAEWVLREFNRLNQADQKLALSLIRTMADERGRPAPSVNNGDSGDPPPDCKTLFTAALPASRRLVGASV